MRKRKDPSELKVQLNLRIKKRIVDQIKEIPRYMPKVERFLENNIEKLKNENADVEKNES